MILRILAAAAIAGVAPLPATAVSPTALQSSRHIRMAHVSVEVIGEGAPVILVPGLSTPRAVWDATAPELALNHRVYLVQVNGFAGDDPGANLAPGVLAGLVADLHRLIADEKLVRPAVVGHSMGGLAGLMLARAHPGDVGKLMVVDALPFIGVLFMPGATVPMIEPQAAMLRDQMAASHGKPADEAVAAGTAARLALKPESRIRVADWVKASDPRVSALALYEDLTTDLRPEMAAIVTPVTLVYPWSAAVPRERADALYRGEYAKVPNMRFVPVGDAAHFVMLDQPAAFREALLEFLDG